MKKVIAGLAVIAVVSMGCTGEDSANEKDAKTSESILIDLQKAHPVPKFRRSQLRQNLVEIITAQANATQTTTFFFNQGVVDPVNECPSIGFPIPATTQLTNPQSIQSGWSDRWVLPQIEPSGVYTGDTTGTYAICIDAEGEGYAVYWEGFVQTVSGPAEWDGKRIKLVGPPSFDFSARIKTR